MGYDRNRFTNRVREELICQICVNVLQDPKRVYPCEHEFCSGCLSSLRHATVTCPVADCRAAITNVGESHPRVTRDLNRLQIRCQFYRRDGFGCQQVVSLETLQTHTNECLHNPDLEHPCDGGCGALLTNAQKIGHRCIETLGKRQTELVDENNHLKAQIAEMQLKLQLLLLPSGSVIQQDLVSTLKRSSIVRDRCVESVMSSVDYGNFQDKSENGQQPQVVNNWQLDKAAVDAKILEVVKNHLKPGVRILDLGLNRRGYLATCLALLAGPTGRVVGYNPGKEYSEQAKRCMIQDRSELMRSGRIKIVDEYDKGLFDVIVYWGWRINFQEPVHQLQPGGLMVVVNKIGDIELSEKLEDGSIKRSQVKLQLNGQAPTAQA